MAKFTNEAYTLLLTIIDNPLNHNKEDITGDWNHPKLGHSGSITTVENPNINTIERLQ